MARPAQTGSPPISSLTHCGAHTHSATSGPESVGTSTLSPMPGVYAPGVQVVQPSVALEADRHHHAHKVRLRCPGADEPGRAIPDLPGEKWQARYAASAFTRRSEREPRRRRVIAASGRLHAVRPCPVPRRACRRRAAGRRSCVAPGGELLLAAITRASWAASEDVVGGEEGVKLRAVPQSARAGWRHAARVEATMRTGPAPRRGTHPGAERVLHTGPAGPPGLMTSAPTRCAGWRGS